MKTRYPHDCGNHHMTDKIPRSESLPRPSRKPTQCSAGSGCQLPAKAFPDRTSVTRNRCGDFPVISMGLTMRDPWNPNYIYNVNIVLIRIESKNKNSDKSNDSYYYWLLYYIIFMCVYQIILIKRRTSYVWLHQDMLLHAIPTIPVAVKIIQHANTSAMQNGWCAPPSFGKLEI